MKELLAKSGNHVYDRRPWPVEPEEEKNENNNIPKKTSTDLLVVYPNPTASKITVEIRAKESEGVLIIKDLLGRSLLYSPVDKEEYILFLNIEQLTPGIYILQFVGLNGQTDAIKVVKL